MIFSKLFKKCQDYPGFSKNNLPMIPDFLFVSLHITKTEFMEDSHKMNLWKHICIFIFMCLIC